MTRTSHQPAASHQLALDAARIFATEPGQRLLNHLRQITRDRVLGPDASDALLRHVEGQRALVRHLEILVQRGRNPADAETRGDADHD